MLSNTLLYAYVSNDPINHIDMLGLTDLNFFNPGNDWKSFSWAADLPSKPATFSIAAHYNGTNILGPHGEVITAETLAGLLSTWPYYTPGTSVQLYVCSAADPYPYGSDNFAQRFADRLNVLTGKDAIVFAPNGTVEAYPEGVFIVPPPGAETGAWIAVEPK